MSIRPKCATCHIKNSALNESLQEPQDTQDTQDIG